MSENIENKERNENFANAYKELVEIIDWFKKDKNDKEFNLDLGLEKSKRGVELLRLLKGRLQDVQREYENIKDKYKEDFPDDSRKSK